MMHMFACRLHPCAMPMPMLTARSTPGHACPLQVNTKVDMRFDLVKATWIPEEVADALRQMVSGAPAGAKRYCGCLSLNTREQQAAAVPAGLASPAPADVQHAWNHMECITWASGLHQAAGA